MASKYFYVLELSNDFPHDPSFAYSYKWYSTSVTQGRTLKDAIRNAEMFMEKGGLRGVRIVKHFYNNALGKTPYPIRVLEWQLDLITGRWSEVTTKKNKRSRAVQRGYQERLDF